MDARGAGLTPPIPLVLARWAPFVPAPVATQSNDHDSADNPSPEAHPGHRPHRGVLDKHLGRIADAGHLSEFGPVEGFARPGSSLDRRPSGYLRQDVLVTPGRDSSTVPPEQIVPLRIGFASRDETVFEGLPRPMKHNAGQPRFVPANPLHDRQADDLKIKRSLRRRCRRSRRQKRHSDKQADNLTHGPLEFSQVDSQRKRFQFHASDSPWPRGLGRSPCEILVCLPCISPYRCCGEVRYSSPSARGGKGHRSRWRHRQ